VKVKKRNGRLENFNVDKINMCAERACKNLENVSASEVLIDAKIKLYDKVTTDEIDKSLIMSARSKIEFEPNYTYMAARMLLNTIYKEVFGEGVDSDAFELQYRKSFITNIFINFCRNKKFLFKSKHRFFIFCFIKYFLCFKPHICFVWSIISIIGFT